MNDLDMNGRQITGKAGEDAACRMLEEKGMMIVARNYRRGHYELDIVAVDGEGLHIVEVRTRTEGDISPASTVDRRKQSNVVAAARKFISENEEFSGYEVFFDIVGVTVVDKNMVLDYIPKAYIPLYV